MARITVGPTGSLITGHVLDSSLKPLERAIKDYDSQLYFKWNPKSLRGWGAWELRRRPDQKTITEVINVNGMSFVKIDYQEVNLVNKLKDFPFLNYKILLWLQMSDTWAVTKQGQDFAKYQEYKEAKILEEDDKRAIESLQYTTKHYKGLIKQFMEYVNSGGNPADIAQFWGQVGSL